MQDRRTALEKEITAEIAQQRKLQAESAAAADDAARQKIEADITKSKERELALAKEKQGIERSIAADRVAAAAQDVRSAREAAMAEKDRTEQSRARIQEEAAAANQILQRDSADANRAIFEAMKDGLAQQTEATDHAKMFGPQQPQAPAALQAPQPPAQQPPPIKPADIGDQFRKAQELSIAVLKQILQQTEKANAQRAAQKPPQQVAVMAIP